MFIDSDNLLNKKFSNLNCKYNFLLPFLVVVSSMLVKIKMGLYIDSDPFWSLAIGKWISEHGKIPVVDVFSWTVYGKPWMAVEWLFCWLVYKLDQALSFIGIDLMVGVVYLLIAYIMLLMCEKLNKSNISIWIYAVGIWFLIYFSATPRAYIFTFLFIVLLMYLIRFKKQSKIIYLTPLIFVMWTNMHSSVVLGIAILFMEALVCTILFRNNKLWFIVFLSLLGTLINPYGIGIWEYFIKYFFSSEMKSIGEWQAPNFNNIVILVLYIIIGATGMLVSCKISKETLKQDKLMIFFWFWVSFLYSLTAVRIIYYVLLFWIPFIVAFMPESFNKKFSIKPIFLVGILGLATCYMLYSFPSKSLLVIPQQIYPKEAINYLENHPELQDKMFNNYIYGGILMCENIKVFIDARADVYMDNNVFQDCMSLSHLKVQPEIILKKYGIKTLFLIKGEQLDIYLNDRPGWKKQYEDRAAVIYVKDS